MATSRHTTSAIGAARSGCHARGTRHLRWRRSQPPPDVFRPPAWFYFMQPRRTPRPHAQVSTPAREPLVPPAVAWRWATGTVLAMVLVTNVASYLRQQPIGLNQGLGWDGQFYAQAAAQIELGRPIATNAPFVYRPGVPWLVAHAPGGEIPQRFFAINLLAANLAVLALAVYLRRHLASPAAWAVCLVLYVLQWHEPLRRVFYYAVHVDFVACPLAIVGLLLVDFWRDRFTAWGLLALVGWSALAVTVHESLLVLPFGALWCGASRAAALPSRGAVAISPGERIWPVLRPTGLSAPGRGSVAALAWGAVPLAVACAVLMCVRSRVTPTDALGSAYYAHHVRAMLASKGFISWVLPWFLVYGPVVVLPLSAYRGTLAYCLERRHAALWLLAFAGLSIVGGSDTERILAWSAPVGYVLVGKALEQLAPRVRGRWPVVALGCLAQAVSQRVFWTLPDVPSGAPHRWPLLTPWSSDFPLGDLFTYTMTTDQAWLVLAQYLAVAAALVGCLRRGRSGETAGKG